MNRTFTYKPEEDSPQLHTCPLNQLKLKTAYLSEPWMEYIFFLIGREISGNSDMSCHVEPELRGGAACFPAVQR